MSSKIQAVRGMNDLLPEALSSWQVIEQSIKQVVGQYSYKEIRTPIVESTSLFSRSIGEVTDIVQKEMYTFNDRNGDSLTLRPEGTASVVRAAIEHGLLHNQTQRLWYMGPMFRHERPQKGRYRQFYQFGLEAFGYSDIGIEFEQLLLLNRLWQVLGIREVITLELNTIGTSEERKRYNEALQNYFASHQASLTDSERERAKQNPLRLLDSKNESLQPLIANAPSLMDYLEPDTKQRFQSLCGLLDNIGVSYIINSRLVRGLDYYSHTVFEWTTTALGAQGTVCAGGRYDRLVEDCGGRPTPAFGFALGLERLVLLLETLQADAEDKQRDTDIAVVVDNGITIDRWMPIVERIRDELPRYKVDVNLSGGSFKSQFKRADKSGASYALVIGEDELNSGELTLEYLRSKKDKCRLSQQALIARLLDEIKDVK